MKDLNEEIIEINSDDNEITVTKENNIVDTINIENNEDEAKDSKINKRKFKDKWHDLDPKKKTLIIVILVMILLLILGIVLYLLIFRKEEDNKKKPENNIEVIEKDNYKYVDGNLIFLDENDKELGSYECNTKDSDQCLVAKLDNNKDTFDRVKNITSGGIEIEKTSKIYFNNFVFVNDGDDKFLYDISKKERLLEVKSIKSYDKADNYVIVENTLNKYGVIKISNDGYNYNINATYDDLGLINSDLLYLLVKEGNNSYIIDINNKKLSSNLKGEVKGLNKDYIIIKTNNVYNLYTYDNDILVSDYDFISLNDEVVALVKTNRLYLLDNHLNKLNEEGIRLESLDYFNQANVYENNKLVEVRKSYTIEVKNNNVIVTSGDTIKSININEGIISNSFEYLSYFDGILYFYSDSNKEDVIGTYTCKNKNVLNSTNAQLKNCNVYTNNDLLSGVYNNEYVFIYDNLSSDTNNIYLYDLKTNKVKSTYTNIEILDGNELNSDVKNIYTSASYIIAQSASGDNVGNYGVLEINSNNVRGKVEFKYKEITLKGSYYLLRNIDDSYSIYDTAFNKISNEFNYIEMYDNYFVGIIDNKLNVYSYTNKQGILKEDLDVQDNKFTIDFNEGFNITIEDVTYNFDFEGNDKNEE